MHTEAAHRIWPQKETKSLKYLIFRSWRVWRVPPCTLYNTKKYIKPALNDQPSGQRVAFTFLGNLTCKMTASNQHVKQGRNKEKSLKKKKKVSTRAKYEANITTHFLEILSIVLCYTVLFIAHHTLKLCFILYTTEGARSCPLLPLLFCFIAIEKWWLCRTFYHPPTHLYYIHTHTHTREHGRVKQHEMHSSFAKVLCKRPLKRQRWRV